MSPQSGGSRASLADYLEASASRSPERTAIVDPDGASLTYGELDARADRLAAFLASRRVGHGDRVALLMRKSSGAIAAMFGVMKAGAAYVPIDPAAPSARVNAILKDCQVRAIFADLRAVGALDGVATAETVVLAGATPEDARASNLPAAVTWRQAIEPGLPLRPLPERNRDDLAYILYTSGSTGVPKGVMLSHGNALSFVDWCSSAFHPAETDRFSSHAPFHFDLSILDIYLALKHGASVHLIDDETGKNPRALAAFIADRRLTVWYSTPSILHLLASFGNLARSACPDLRLVLFAGEVFAVKHLRELTGLWPHPRYYNLYGPTETNVCTYAPISLPIPEDRSEPYPIGHPCSHCAAVVLDAQGNAVPEGGEGVLHIAGESVFQGYWGRPDLDNAAFRWFGGRRWYSTGDVVREDPVQGFIYVGRRDRMVKRRGYRIELGDIECALYRHRDIREAGVVAAPAGDGELKIVAWLTAAGGRKAGVLELKSFCARNLPAYMIPDAFTFLDCLPRTSTGKVDYQALALRTAAGASAPAA